jgi:hypothetical protein
MLILNLDLKKKLLPAFAGDPAAGKQHTKRQPPLSMLTGVHFLITGIVVTGGLWLYSQSSSAVPVYLDPKQPIERRVDDLINRMTLKEKVGQLNLPCVYVDELGETVPEKMIACRRFAAGTYTNEIGPGCGFFTFAETTIILAFEKTLGAPHRVSKQAASW